jgi:class 3 adenylate cyclase
VTGFPAEVAAARAGISRDAFDRLKALGILGTAETYTDADVRRVHVARALERSGLSVDSLATLIREGRMSLEFIDHAGYGVFAALSDETFADVASRTGIDLDQLVTLREMTIGAAAAPDDRIREDELQIVPLVQLQLELGFRWPAIIRALRVYADSLRRAAEGEAEWWRSEVQEPMHAAGQPAVDLAERAREVSPALSRASDQALMAIYHAQQMQVWSVNIVDGIALALEQAGLHLRSELQPAMAFLDVSGYTQLTTERGDEAAVALVDRLSRIVQPIAVRHGGRSVKWLGDGVMFHFRDPGGCVIAAIEMVEAIDASAMPPAHVGIAVGPVIVQEADYYGQTVNLASRIGDYARPGEVLVSESAVAAARGSGCTFQPIGAVALKGVATPVELFSARRG